MKVFVLINLWWICGQQQAIQKLAGSSSLLGSSNQGKVRVEGEGCGEGEAIVSGLPISIHSGSIQVHPQVGAFKYTHRCE